MSKRRKQSDRAYALIFAREHKGLTTNVAQLLEEWSRVYPNEILTKGNASTILHRYSTNRKVIGQTNAVKRRKITQKYDKELVIEAVQELKNTGNNSFSAQDIKKSIDSKYGINIPIESVYSSYKQDYNQEQTMEKVSIPSNLSHQNITNGQKIDEYVKTVSKNNRLREAIGNLKYQKDQLSEKMKLIDKEIAFLERLESTGLSLEDAKSLLEKVS